MSPDTLAKATVRESPVLRTDQDIGEAIRAIVAAELPALPVVDHDGRLFGIFGEREFIGALFPGYLAAMRSAAFVPPSIDDVIDRRLECGLEPVSKYATTEGVAAGLEHSDVQLAETFLHHRVLIVPIVDDGGGVAGIVTRSDFFRSLVERFRERS